MSRWTIQYKRGPSHGIAIPTDPLYSPTVPTDPLRARAALLKQAFVPGVEKGVRSLVAEEGAEDDGESALRSLELVEALCDGKCVHAALAAHHIKQQEATIASLTAELEQARADGKLAVSCLHLMSVSNYRF